MAQVQEAKFSCQKCGASYRWKPELAGKKVKCKCGAVMTVPAKQPGAPAPAPARAARGSDEPDLDAMYDLAEEGKAVAEAAAVEAPSLRCPACKSALEPGASVCTGCGFNLKTGKKGGAAKPAAMSAGRAPGGATVAPAGKAAAGGALAAYGTPKRQLQQESRGENKALDFFIPIGIIIVGFGLAVLTSFSIDTSNVPLPQATLHAGLRLIIGFILIAIGGIFCVKWGEIAFGEPGPAALKVAAMAIGPPALAGIVSILVHDVSFRGLKLVGFFLALGMFFIMVHYLFEWDMNEKWIVSSLATCVTMAIVPGLFALILAGGFVPGVKSGNTSEDKQIDYMVGQLGMPKPLDKWMSDSTGRIFGTFTRDDSNQLCKDLYALGPKDREIWVVMEDKDPRAAEIYIKLPSDDKKRKAFFDLVSTWNKAHQRGAVTDGGEKWLILRFLPFARPEPVNMF